MRTTIRIDDGLFAEVKTYAAHSGRTLNAVVEEALREAIARRARTNTSGAVALPTFAGSRLLPGVDLDDGVALRDLIEGPPG